MIFAFIRLHSSGCGWVDDEVVLPDRIELSTSPLPMECSTTELRQHARYSRESAQKAPTGGRFLPQGPLWRKHAATEERPKTGKNPRGFAGCRADPVPGLPGRRPKRRDERESCLEFDHFGLIALRRDRRFLAWLCKKDGDCAGVRGETQYVRVMQTPGRRTMKDVKDSRAARLKLALRENLKRRKSQARGRSEEAAPSSEPRMPP